jgi:hypothetical protein
MRPVLIPRCVGVEKPQKKPGQAAPGLEPGTSRVQSGALGAWPRCSVPDEQEMICFKLFKIEKFLVVFLYHLGHYCLML